MKQKTATKERAPKPSSASMSRVSTRLAYNGRRAWKSRYLYLLLLPTLAWYAIFMYGPMYGLQIAFKDFMPFLGIEGSPWVGFKHFISFFQSEYFWRLIKNTLGISLYSILVGFPVPILLALLMNEVGNKYFKKGVQTIAYLPPLHFRRGGGEHRQLHPLPQQRPAEPAHRAVRRRSGSLYGRAEVF